MKKLFGALLSILMLLSIIMPISAETTTATSNPGVLYFGGKEVTTDKIEINEETKNQLFTIEGVSELSVSYKYTGFQNNFKLENVNLEGNVYSFKLPSTYNVSSMSLEYKIDGVVQNVKYNISSSIQNHFHYYVSYQLIGDYKANNTIYTIKDKFYINEGVYLSINGEKINNIIVSENEDRYKFNVSVQGESGLNEVAFEIVKKPEGEFYVTEIFADGVKLSKHFADVEIVGIDITKVLGTDSEPTKLNIAQNETIILKVSNVSNALINNEGQITSIGEICLKGKENHDYTKKNIPGGFEVTTTLNELGNYTFGVSVLGTSSVFDITVVESKSEVLNSINKDNAEDVITSLQNVINPNNTNVSVKDVKVVSDNYKAITGNNVSEKVDGTVKGFDVDGLAPALVSLEAGKTSQQTATMSVNESKETIKLPETLKAELVKTLDITVSSTENKLSTSELQLPVAITFNPSDMGVKVDNGETLKVVREHNGQQDILDATKNSDGTFTFVTDKFSTYGIIKLKDVVVEETKPVAPSVHCAGSKDKNCDGVITCDEEKGLGWEWNNDKKVCEFKGNSSIYVVNTATK